MTTTLYGLKNCDTCRKARKWLDRFGVAHEFIDYRDEKPGPETLVEWARQAGGFESLINQSYTTWRQLPDNRKGAASEPAWQLVLRASPQLVIRPGVVTDANGRATGRERGGKSV